MARWSGVVGRWFAGARAGLVLSRAGRVWSRAGSVLVDGGPVSSGAGLVGWREGLPSFSAGLVTPDQRADCGIGRLSALRRRAIALSTRWRQRRDDFLGRAGGAGRSGDRAAAA